MAPKPWLIGLAVVTVTLLGYAPTLDGPFIWDDRQLILGSARVTDGRPWREYFSSAFWVWADLLPGGRSYYRPLSTLSFALDYGVHNENAGGYHLTNLLFHSASALLLFALLRKRRVSELYAGLLSLSWALFPRLTEAAAWISGRTDVLATFFALLGIWCATFRMRAGRWAAAVCIFVGLLAKEVAAAGLIGLMAFEWREGRNLPRREQLARLLPLAASAIAYGVLRRWAVGAAIQDNGLSAGQRTVSALEALGRYPYMLIDGWHPSIQIGYLGAPSLPFVVLGGLVAIAAAVGIFRLRGRLDALGLAALTTLLGSVGLVLHLLPITVNIVAADRFLYLPLASFVLLLAPTTLRVPVRIFGPLLGALTLSYGAVTFVRCKVWSDEVDFWLTALREQRDHNAMSRVELGNVYGRAGLYTQALSLYLDPDDEDFSNYLLARHNAGTALLALGRYAEGEVVLAEVVRQAPTVGKFQVSLATAQVALDRPADAKEHIAIALRMNPDSVAAQRLRKTLIEIDKSSGQPAPDLSTTSGKLAAASRHALFGRGKTALDLLVEASAAPDMSLRELVSAFPLAFDQGKPRQLSALFERYTALGGRSPAVRESYDERMQRVRRLRAIWPSLSAYRTVRGQPSPAE